MAGKLPRNLGRDRVLLGQTWSRLGFVRVVSEQAIRRAGGVRGCSWSRSELVRDTAEDFQVAAEEDFYRTPGGQGLNRCDSWDFGRTNPKLTEQTSKLIEQILSKQDFGR